jgi:hypothetical protein
VLTWLDIFPERVEYEASELRDLGFELDKGELADQRRLVMRGVSRTSRGEIALTIVYPDSFPYLRPEVFATEIALERHHNPYEGQICLLDRSSRAWDVDLTGAWLISERIPHLIELLEHGGDRLRAEEVPQGEPTSAYFLTQAGTAVFVPVEALSMPEDAAYGQMELWLGANDPRTVTLRALLGQVSTKGGRHGRVLASADPQLAKRFGTHKVKGRWVRLPELPNQNTPKALLRAAAEVWPEVSRPQFAGVNDGQISVLGCVFSEEVRQNRWEDSWLFIVHHRRVRAGVRNEGDFLVRGERLSRADLGERIPRLARLGDKHVAVLGLGALGAPIVMELARAGIGRLSLLDFDRVEVGNCVRWPFGISTVGHDKVAVLQSVIAQDFPYTEVSGMNGRIGYASDPASLEQARTQSELDVIKSVVGDADVVIDATAEIGVQHLISALVTDRPVIYTWATEGAAGGAVVRVRPGPGCWLCLQHALDDGTVPLPSADPEETIQPRGCASPTFTGANYDLAPVAAQAARVAVATLTGDGTAEDISIMSLRDSDGRTLPAPNWQCFPLEVHRACVFDAVETNAA